MGARKWLSGGLIVDMSTKIDFFKFPIKITMGRVVNCWKLVENEGEMRKAMTADELTAEQQEAVLIMVNNCSFRKRHTGRNNEPLELTPLLLLLCSADLAEATGFGCL